jgi:DNA-binding transcriptional LysR family regulator
MADELVVVVAPDHPWVGRGSIGVEDIRREPLILRERGSGSRETLERALAAVGLDFGAFRIVGEMGSTQAIKQAIRAGFGVSLISRRAVEDECRAGLLGCVAVRDLDVSRAFHLVTHRERSRSPLAQAFLAFVAAQSPDRSS